MDARVSCEGKAQGFGREYPGSGLCREAEAEDFGNGRKGRGIDDKADNNWIGFADRNRVFIRIEVKEKSNGKYNSNGCSA